MAHDREKIIQWLEFGAGVVLSVVIVVLHVVFFRGAGAFWRDEINSINLATMPTFLDIWHCLRWDSFPLLISAVLRGWISIVGASEISIRVYGLIAGILLLTVMWMNVRAMGRSAPLISLVLFAFNPVAIRGGDSIRAYGLGMVLILLTYTFLWKVIYEPTKLRVIGTTVAAILSVQCLYHNAFLLAGMTFAGVVVTLRSGRWRRALLLVAIAAVAASSLTPYWKVLKLAQDWAIVLKTNVPVGHLLRVLRFSLSAQAGFVFWIWIGLFAYGLIRMSYIQVRGEKTQEAMTQRDMALFCGISAIGSIVLLLAFYWLAGSNTNLWYYLPMMAIVTLFLDTILVGRNIEWVLRVVLIFLIPILTLGSVWDRVEMRQSNVDLVSSMLEEKAGADDLIVIVPWHYRLSFDRYYEGTTKVLAVPPVEGIKIHRYDLLKEMMVSVDPIGPVLSAIEKTLKAGHKVWVLGDLGYPAIDMMHLPEAPKSKYGWYLGSYESDWKGQVTELLHSHGLEAERLPAVTDDLVNPDEDVTVTLVRSLE